MLGPLPTFYRVIVSVCALVSFIGIGAWLGYLLPETALAFVGTGIGTGIGAGLGVVAIVLLVHDSEHSRPRARSRH